MWKLEKRFTFEAAHKLPRHDGKCRRLHGHSWAAVVRVGGEKVHETGAKTGMVVDYADIKAAMQPLLDEYLDHHYLNQSLDMPDPTSELIAQWLYEKLRIRITGLLSVTVEETCTCACTYDGIWCDGSEVAPPRKGQVGQ